MSGSDDNSTDGGLLGSLRRALEHAEGALRCYLAILAAEVRRLVRLSMREAVWLAALLGVGLIGLTLLAFGLATFIGSHLETPGAGFVIVGGVMVAAFLVIMFVVKALEER